MPVGGSRHYQGAGLGQVGLWGCPTCGADNTGPLEQGCVSCGAGRPAPRPEPVPPPPPVPRVSERTADDPTYTRTHALIDEAYQAGYRAGYAHGQRAAWAEQGRPPQPETPTQEGKVQRTIIAALSLFRDQVLAGSPEEVTTGEWLSVAEVDLLIRRLQLELREVSHAV